MPKTWFYQAFGVKLKYISRKFVYLINKIVFQKNNEKENAILLNGVY